MKSYSNEDVLRYQKALIACLNDLDEFPGTWVPTTQGKSVLVSIRDFDNVSQYKWYAHSKGYAARRISGVAREFRKIVFLHRWLVCAPLDMQVDHANRYKWDCRRNNLRIVKNDKNQQNIGMLKNNKSGYKGVWWDSSRDLWVCDLSHENKTIHLGRFRHKEEAAMAYDRKILELRGEFAVTNFPREYYE